MANLTTRSLTTSTVSTANLNKGSALTIAEMDSNFLNLNTDKIDTTGPQTFSGDLTITTGTSSAVGSIILKEAANNGTNSITLKANVAMASDLNFILPPDAGSNGYGLTTDGSGNLSWTESAGDITAVIAGDGLTGGATSGSATINVVGGTGIDANADDISIDDTVVATLSGSQILTNKTLTTPIISSISNTGTLTLPTSTDTLVGRATTDTLTNKTLTSPVLNTGVSGTAIKDEDNMSSDSDTHLATQQSIKAYVDSQVATKDTIAELNDVDTTGIANNKILKYNSTSSNWEMADDGGSGIALTDLSVGAEGTAAGDGSLAYNNSTGVFTYTPPVLSGLSGDTDDIAEGSTNLYYTNSRVNSYIQNSIEIGELSNVDETGVANDKILKYNSTTSNWEVADDSGGIALTDLSVGAEGTASGDGAIAYNNTTGVFTYTPPVLSGLTGDTDDVGEGSTNLYFTNARADARVNLQTGTNLDLSNKSTSDLGEGTNQYFTQSRARTSLSVGSEASASGDGAIAYNDSTGVFTYTPPTAAGIGALADVVSDTTPELGGTLDILGNDIKSSTANVVISADSTDKDVILKIKDAGGTLQTAATLRDYSYTENATDGDSGTAATNYKPVLDVDQGIRIGNDSANFSSTDAAGNNNTDDFNQLGILVDNGDEDKWPQVSLTSYGGANPLRNRSGDAAIGGTQTVTGLSGTGGTGSSATFDVYRNGLSYEKPSSGNTDGINNAGSGYTAGDTIVITGDNFSNAFFGTPGQTPENDLTVTVDTVDGSGAITAVSFSGTAQGGLATHYSTSAISLKAASGTSSSPQRLFQGARIGQISFTGYDGNKFGGTNAIASASLTVEATEHHSTSNARGAKAYFDILKTGGASTDGDSTSDRIKGWSLQGDEFTINPDSRDLDFAVNGDTVSNIIKVDAANESFSSASAKIDFTNLPTSDPAVAGRLWNDSGTLKVSAG